MTRCGKTVLTRALSAGFAGPPVHPRQLVVILDSKREPRLREIVPQESRSIPETGGWCRVCPMTGEEAEPYLDAIWRRGDVWFWIDELPLIGDERKAPPTLEKIYRAGAARNIGGVSLSQDPVCIPRVVKSQSSAFIIGPNGVPDYVTECGKLCHQEPGPWTARVASLPRFRFLYWDWDMGRDAVPPREIGVRDA